MKKNFRQRDRQRSRNAYHEARRAANDRKQEAQYKDGLGSYRAMGFHFTILTDEVTAAMEAGGLTQSEWDTVVDVQKEIEAMPEMEKS